MKKILLASTMLAAFATVADAETGVKISGYGRFGLQYADIGGDSGTFIHTRLRLNIDATTETDAGVTFGGRIRLQQTSGLKGLDGYGYVYGANGTTNVSDALLYVEYEGLRVEVGNVNTAFDSAALIYDSELGLTDSSYGDSRTNFFSFTSGHNSTGYSGVYASYSIDNFSAQLSYVDPKHYLGGAGAPGVGAETSLALSYSMDQFTVSAAGVWNGAGQDGNDAFFVGGAYNLSDVATVGLNYIDEGEDGGGTSLGKTIVLYGNYKMDAITLKAYIAHNDYAGNTDDTAYGIGADYDLGGAKLTGGIQRGYSDDTVADVGVRFNF